MPGVITPTTLTGPTGTTPFVAFLPPNPQLNASGARPVIFRFTGLWTGLQGVFEGSFDLSLNASGVPNFAGAFPIAATGMADGSTLSSSQSVPIAVPDSTAANTIASAYRVQPYGGMGVRFRVVQLGSGGPIADGRDTDFFSETFNIQTIAIATLWQMQHLTFLIAQLDDGKAAASWVPNPLLPANLLPPAWDTSG